MKKVLWWKKIEELMSENKRLQDKIDHLNQVIRNRDEINEHFLCDGYCQNCKNVLKTEEVNYWCGYESRRQLIKCKLDYKCPDFVEKEENK